MRIRLKGLNSITKRLADGTTRTYWYAWKGGPPLHLYAGQFDELCPHARFKKIFIEIPKA